MAEQTFPFGSGAGASITDAQFRAFFRNFCTDGVVSGAGSQLGVSAGSGMQSNIGTGSALLDGLFYNNDASKAVTHAAADPTNPRIDLIVVHVNQTNATDSAGVGAYAGAAIILKGTPAGSPVAPVVTQTDGTVWEIALCQVRVPAGASSSASFTYTDVRTYSIAGGKKGSGSGLDADMVDGHNASYFLPALASAGGGAAGVKIWVGTTDPGASASEGDIWIDA